MSQSNVEIGDEVQGWLSDHHYKEGFYTDISTDTLEKGLNEAVVRAISAKRNEPEWMLEFRLDAYRHWLEMEEPHWLKADYPSLNYQDYSYYSAPSCSSCCANGSCAGGTNEAVTSDKQAAQDYLTKEVEDAFNQLGVPVREGQAVAVDAIFDSVSVSTTYREELAEHGIIFCSFSEAIQEYPDLVRQYLGTVVSSHDNYFAALNAAVASDGTFVYIPKGVRCPMELSTYFRINAAQTGQFERTILVADEGSYVSYIEGCSAPVRDSYQLHAAVVEVIIHKDAEVKYSTVQNWFSGGDSEGGILNFVTKRAICEGENAKMSWTQSETGSAITWKYPSVILKGDNSTAEFFSVALTNGNQQADTGTKMIHIGKNTKSTIISKGISAGKSQNSYRGLVKVLPGAQNARNFTQCDSMLIGTQCGAHTFPYVEVMNNSAQLEHEATTSRIGEDQLFYCRQRGLSEDDAISMIVNGFCKDVFSELPLEFAVEAQKLLAISLEHSVG
ncbi:Fe-S cluster assembly protein SufB [Proteus sp. GOKU]|uniref:Fe-S cluster assembly protein SufB n=1 Tax=Proteus terrae subsp. cibarius TaxID=626774 RepID=A0A6G6SW68_9GAMM|nr:MULTISPECIES: Fe-S cluster assembly protein SufB [Proteus]MDY3696078.1 Fe-S cluster assembly protein SufB [Proteus mirabilis]MBG2912963.1 Fe-S cluster assembly protein SufB [Proteus terrae subsp. cibarius]MBG3091408.1 Fe-S cluster assembly protein SufB [Proteus terrae subsp. cibarius]MBG5948201.1 Fe-S cluster assembly protein SufB [Proteus terrae]MBG6038147.1 Fe-S cluster assembly protein SufB [Proteus terrae subsp. cibarius]